MKSELKDWGFRKYTLNKNISVLVHKRCKSEGKIGTSIKVDKIWVCTDCLEIAPLSIQYIADLCKCFPYGKIWADDVKQRLENRKNIFHKLAKFVHKLAKFTNLC